MKLQTSSHSCFKYTLLYYLLTFIISIGPQGIPVRTVLRHGNFLQLNSKKGVHYCHKQPEHIVSHDVNSGSFLQTEKRCLNRDEIEITPQPLEWRGNNHCFTQLKKTNLKTAKKSWDVYNEVQGECDNDDTDDGIEDDDDAWDV